MDDAPTDRPPHVSTAPARSGQPHSVLGWRLLALFYDLWPALALWMASGTVFVIAFTVVGHATRENIAPYSAWQWALWASCWWVTGLYATFSWRRGGQTLGMRPWRLRLLGGDGGTPSSRSLWLRYAVGTLSLLLFGAGFWWSLLDREHLTWHDRASGTRLVRMPRRAAGSGRSS